MNISKPLLYALIGMHCEMKVIDGNLEIKSKEKDPLPAVFHREYDVYFSEQMIREAIRDIKQSFMLMTYDDEVIDEIVWMEG